MERFNDNAKSNNKIRRLASKIGKIGRLTLKNTEKIMPTKCICNICNSPITNYNYQNHFKSTHNMSKEEYFSKNQNQLKYKTKNYVFVNTKIVPKGVIRKKDYGDLTITQIKLLMLVKSYHITAKEGIKLPILEDLMFKRAHPDISSAYELFNQYKKILGYIKPLGKKVGETKEYLTIRYGENLAKHMIKQKSTRVTGKNNPGYQHNGSMSAYSNNFVKYKNKTANYTKEDVINKRKKTMKDKPEINNTKIEYYLRQGLSQTDAKVALSNRQVTNGLAWYESKYGKKKGPELYNIRMKKWMTSFKRCNFSKISQELFDAIAVTYETKNVYYATHNRPEMIDYINKEFILKLSKSYVRPDFVDVNAKKIIEFDGEYWHSNRLANPTREKERDQRIIAEGYAVLHVSETNYIENKQKVINECLDFLQFD